MTTAVVIVIGYLLGSLPFAWVLARSAAGVDLRTVGSGNVGATNLLRATGVPMALIAALLDTAKGVTAVWVAGATGVDDTARAACGVAAVLGHVYPVWLHFRGGRASRRRAERLPYSPRRRRSPRRSRGSWSVP